MPLAACAAANAGGTPPADAVKFVPETVSRLVILSEVLALRRGLQPRACSQPTVPVIRSVGRHVTMRAINDMRVGIPFVVEPR